GSTGHCVHGGSPFLFPSPIGRRWREASDEGTAKWVLATSAYPRPNPSPDGRGLNKSTLVQLGGAMHRRADARVGAAAAEVAGQCLVDVGIGWRGNLRQQRNRRHDLPG